MCHIACFECIFHNITAKYKRTLYTDFVYAIGDFLKIYKDLLIRRYVKIAFIFPYLTPNTHLRKPCTKNIGQNYEMLRGNITQIYVYLSFLIPKDCSFDQIRRLLQIFCIVELRNELTAPCRNFVMVLYWL